MSIFSKVRARKVKRSTFNLSHSNKLTCDMGELIPILCEPVIPGDTWQVKSDLLIRFAPLIAPVMHKIDVYTHYFYVPYRLIWDNWETFWSGENEANGKVAPVFPQWQIGLDYGSFKYGDLKNASSELKSKFEINSLVDYLNFPVLSDIPDSSLSQSWNNNLANLTVSILPFRAYQCIWNEYYRDENLQTELDFDKGDGVFGVSSVGNSEVTAQLFTLRRRAWQKDYFTSALPWTQKGPQQMVPVETIIASGTKVKVAPDTVSLSSDIGFNVYDTDGKELGQLIIDQSAGGGQLILKNVDGSNFSGTPSSFVGASGYVTVGDLNAAGASFDINELRRSNRIQQWLERNARGGSRYIELLKSHFGVISDDLRLQRPEMLGGGKSPVQISDTIQTSETTSSSPQGQYAGVGFSYGNQNGFKRSFKEPGLVLGIMSVMPKPGYMSGVPRNWLKTDKFDFYWPEFAELGEQEIYNSELSLLATDQYGTFGYAPRYAEYKYIPDRVHGDFKKSLDFWNLAREFGSAPALNEEFIECNPSNRIFAVEDAGVKHLYVELMNNITARRPMPYLPDPSL